ncbi:hypothetical protein M2459_001237 [Parabacteroides sp. PF5-5]|uniref:hypothetical protein n=1 Tax=unclassified Parabacteroides TaxID=2649774 RepID=UPI00247519ED|nr:MULTISPECIES: hypothetical protein [unclassified Parabacteroides]MDH6304504.1 hypothetical protein [Parabacteroides sp. PH5-39]MDH6315343.1 hypothetical protein [Parabacteroides sp. PF5-13]MDH6319163.1 hypothetical protein [Parabacteroides sp. PH5-13]MDH6322893.1 hypothetical protein [Parabacteroides sp. PH5-8]MDH6326535.1 hypothetical protein [Parabacteroides sp. PH5-41]
MKTFVSLAILVLLMMSGFSSCDFIFGHQERESDAVSYYLALSFQDASGNDLVKGIGLEEWGDPTDIPDEYTQSGYVKRDLYILDIVASKACRDVILSKDKRPQNHSLSMDRFDGYSFLENGFGFDIEDCSDEKVITYKLRCPYVFDDYEKHEFVTYWEIPKIHDGVGYAKCIRVEFEDKVFNPITSNDDGYNRIVIILDGKDNL